MHEGCGGSGENVVGGRRLSPSDFDLESNGEGMMIGKARKAGRGHLEEKCIIQPMLVRQPRWGQLWADPMSARGATTRDGMTWLLWSEVPHLLC